MIIKEFSNEFCVSGPAIKALGQFSSKFDT